MVSWLGTYSAEIIAICALFFTAYQAIIQRRHNLISVKPHLFTFTTRHRYSDSGSLEFLLSNNGLGPAYIDDFKIYLKGQPCEPTAAVKSVLGDLSKNATHTILGNDYAMPEKESKIILAVKFPCTTEEEFERIESKIQQLDLVIRYKSAYGESFSFDTRENS